MVRLLSLGFRDERRRVSRKQQHGVMEKISQHEGVGCTEGGEI